MRRTGVEQADCTHDPAIPNEDGLRARPPNDRMPCLSACDSGGLGHSSAGRWGASPQRRHGPADVSGDPHVVEGPGSLARAR